MTSYKISLNHHSKEIVNDLGTAFLHKRHKIELGTSDDGVFSQARVADQRMIDRLFLLRVIDQDQYQAADNYYEAARKSGAWASMEMKEFVDNPPRNSYPRVLAILGLDRYLRKKVGIDSANEVWRVVVRELPANLDLLLTGLDALANRGLQTTHRELSTAHGQRLRRLAQ
jgi:hypothetical protein